MKKIICCIAATSCLATFASLAMAEGGMMRHGEFADRYFKEMDANGDGAISQKEFNTFHEKRFKEMDANHDGKVTREEMDSYHDKIWDQAREHFKNRFDEADANHDGALSKEEAQKMPMVSQYFDEIDANHDGKVTHDEIRAYMGNMRGHGGMMYQGGMHGDGMPCDGAMYGGGMMRKEGAK